MLCSASFLSTSGEVEKPYLICAVDANDERLVAGQDLSEGLLERRLGPLLLAREETSQERNLVGDGCAGVTDLDDESGPGREDGVGGEAMRRREGEVGGKAVDEVVV